MARTSSLPIAFVAAAFALAACSGATPEPGPSVTTSSGSGGSTSTTTGSAGETVVTFEVAGGERFKVGLTDPEPIDHARKLLAGENISAIPLGTVVRDDPGPNAPWTWHLDPATFSFAFATIEVCDGIPSDVQKQVITSDEYCPWSAKVVAVEPPA